MKGVDGMNYNWIHMNKVALLLVLALAITVVVSVQEIPMRHHKRTPREAQRLLDYLNRGPMTEKVYHILAKIFPSELTPNLYAYPEVKILNYLDAQYYGYFHSNLDKSMSELLLSNSVLSSTLDPPTFGFPPRSADSLLPATFTNTSTLPRAQPMFKTVLTLTSPMDQVLFQDSLDKIQFGSQDLRLRKLFSLKSLPSTESASLHPNSMVSLVWPGLKFQSMAFL